MKATKIDIFVATFVLLSITVRSELDAQKVQSTDFFELLREPKLSEKNICDKVSQMMKEFLNEDIKPKNFYEAFNALSTVGLGQYTNNKDFEEVNTSFNNRFSEEEKKLTSFINSSEESIDKFEDMINSFDEFNQYYFETYEINLRARLALGDFDINKDFNEFYNLLLKFVNKYNSYFKKYESKNVHDDKLFNLSGSYTNFIQKSNSMFQKLAEINSNRIFKYVINLKAHLISFLNAKYKRLQKKINPNEIEYRLYSQILFATYALVLKTNDNERKKYLDYLKKLINMIDENDDLYATFKRLFQDETVIGSSDNKLRDYVYNINFLSYNGDVLKIDETNYELYAEQNVEFKLRFGKGHRNALNIAENWAKMFKFEDFRYFILEAMFDFVFTATELTNEDIYIKFDNYLSGRNNNPEFINIIKILNGIRGTAAASNKTWEFIKMMPINDEGVLRTCIESGNDLFKENLRILKQKSNMKDKTGESYEVLMITEIKTEWLVSVSSTTVENNSKHLEAKIELKYRDLDPLNFKFINYSSELQIEHENQEYNQIKGKYDEKEIENEEDEEDDEENKENEDDKENLKQSHKLESSVKAEDVNKINEHADKKLNKIVKVIGNLSPKAENQLIEDNLLDRIKEGEEISGFDKIVYINLIPGDTPCYEAIIAQLLSKKE